LGEGAECDTGNTTWVILVGEELVGTISCFPMDGQDHVGYWIDRAYWGRGIASRALQLLLREVAKRPLVATAATSNGASIRGSPEVRLRRRGSSALARQ
jgi:RimJ/RimL family protein N-acetyltransferase